MESYNDKKAPLLEDRLELVFGMCGAGIGSLGGLWYAHREIENPTYGVIYEILQASPLNVCIVMGLGGVIGGVIGLMMDMDVDRYRRLKKESTPPVEEASSRSDCEL